MITIRSSGRSIRSTSMSHNPPDVALLSIYYRLVRRFLLGLGLLGLTIIITVIIYYYYY